MDVIHLQDMSFYAYHGLYDEEAKLGQRFTIDLSCWLDLDAACTQDDYTLTVCYASLTRLVEKVVTTCRFNLIERLAGAISEEVLASDERIKKVRIRVRKPGAPLPLATGQVSVEIERLRRNDIF